MIDEKFILEHIDEISELRDFNEVYEYFVANGIQVNAAEVMALKDSPNLATKLEVNSRVLTMQQLDCVAGGVHGWGLALGILGVVGSLVMIGTGIGAVAGAATLGAAIGGIGSIVGGVVGAGMSGYSTYAAAIPDSGSGQDDRLKFGVQQTFTNNNAG